MPDKDINRAKNYGFGVILSSGMVNFIYLNITAIFIFIILSYSQVVYSQERSLTDSLVKSGVYERDVVELNSGKIDDYFYNSQGTASWYGKKFHLRKTANGEVFNMYDYSAAHRDLPFGTILKVTNIENNSSVLVRINDRGPFVGNRILDLSYTASLEIGNTGLSKVLIEGFVMNGSRDWEDEPLKDLYFCYSVSLPLTYLYKTDLEIIGFSNDFNEVIKLYKNYLILHRNNLCYIVIPSEQVLIKDKGIEKYYIAVIDPRINKKIKEIVRNK